MPTHCSKIIIETARLLLRETTESDADFYFKLMNSAGWIQYIGDRNVRSIEGAMNYINEKVRPSYRQNGYGMYTIERKSDGVSVGVCGLVNRETLPNPDLGFALMESYGGMGYALESSRAVLQLARKTFKMNTVLAITLRTNARSIALIERLGFAEDAELMARSTDPELAHYAIAL